MNTSKSEKLIEIFATFSGNLLFIERYIKKVPDLISNDISERETESEKSQFKKNQNDTKIIEFLKSGWNSLVSMGVASDKIYFPIYFHSSTLLLIFALLEDTSWELGKVAKSLSQSRLGMRDINKKGDVRKVKLYLEKHLGIDFTDINNDWQKIEMYTQIRNHIIHKNSRIRGDDGKDTTKFFLEHLKNDDRIEFDGEKFTIVDKEYVLEFLTLSQNFICFITEKLQDKYH